MARPPFTRIIQDLPHSVPFVGPEAQERARGKPFRARLGANESHWGPSPKAVAAMEAAASESWKYCDPENFELRAAIAKFHSVKPDNVVIGEGIDGLLGLTIQLFIEPGDRVITSDGAYPTFNFHVVSRGGRLVKVPYQNDREDIEGLLTAAREASTKIIYLSNPDNPMGTWWTARDLTNMLDKLPDGVLLILDEAYCDTAPADAQLPINTSDPRVVHYRTFSKAYGMAGARIGYAIGEAEVIAAFEKVRNHYGINRTAQIGALAAIEDQAHLAACVAAISDARKTISSIACRNELAPIPSAANFVTIDCGRDGDFARRLLENLLARDVFIRKPWVAPLDRCIRVSCGFAPELDIFAHELAAALKDLRG